MKYIGLSVPDIDGGVQNSLACSVTSVEEKLKIPNKY